MEKLSCDIEEFDDLQLVQMVKNKDENALNVLFSRYESFIKSNSSMLNYPGIDFEDLIQEGRIGLVSAVNNFRCDAGASFKTYACLCIKRKIVSAVKNALNYKNNPMNTYIPIDDLSKELSYSERSQNPEETVINKEQITAIRSALSNMFTSDERKIFLMYLSGYSYKNIAETFDIEVKQVDNSLQRVKRKLNMILS